MSYHLFSSGISECKMVISKQDLFSRKGFGRSMLRPRATDSVGNSILSNPYKQKTTVTDVQSCVSAGCDFTFSSVVQKNCTISYMRRVTLESHNDWTDMHACYL